LRSPLKESWDVGKASCSLTEIDLFLLILSLQASFPKIMLSFLLIPKRVQKSLDFIGPIFPCKLVDKKTFDRMEHHVPTKMTKAI
jgi:hypothetical protein